MGKRREGRRGVKDERSEGWRGREVKGGEGWSEDRRGVQVEGWRGGGW